MTIFLPIPNWTGVALGFSLGLIVILILAWLSRPK